MSYQCRVCKHDYDEEKCNYCGYTNIIVLDDKAEKWEEERTYYIEVMGYDQSTVIGVSEGLTYEQAISQNRLIDDLSSMAASVQAWTGSSYAAPEPTSGLLLLLGGALLALKRRRA